MAIVFISPKQKQKVLLYIIIGTIASGLIIFGLLVFLPKPKPTPVEQVFRAPKIEINFEILESEKVKALQLFEGIKKEFVYQGKTEEGKIQSGKILAASREEGIQLLEELGLLEIEIEDLPVGRDNPFAFPKEEKK